MSNTKRGGPRIRTGRSSIGDEVIYNDKKYVIAEYLECDSNVEHVQLAPLNGERPAWRASFYAAGILKRTGKRYPKPEYKERDPVYADWSNRHIGRI